MIISATFSKPGKDAAVEFGRPYTKIKIKTDTSSAAEKPYTMEMFTEKQVFHSHLSSDEAEEFIRRHGGTTFKNCNIITDDGETSVMANRKGKISRLFRKSAHGIPAAPVKEKNHIIREGCPAPFLVLLGVMTDSGKVIAKKQDKFRQVNRFLEFLDDIIPEVQAQIAAEEGERPLRIADFGCGKSYLTFAVHYYMNTIKQIPCAIEGLDLRQDVIDYCNGTAEKLGCKNLVFRTGDIAGYSEGNPPDIIITLHACDTATDYALDYAVRQNCRAILSVPCCQHELNTQLSKTAEPDPVFAPLTKWGIIRERFSALATDAVRGEFLESEGYSVQMLEFIDIEHTPKNLLIRAVRRRQRNSAAEKTALRQAELLAERLGVKPKILAPDIKRNPAATDRTSSQNPQ